MPEENKKQVIELHKGSYKSGTMECLFNVAGRCCRNKLTSRDPRVAARNEE